MERNTAPAAQTTPVANYRINTSSNLNSDFNPNYDSSPNPNLSLNVCLAYNLRQFAAGAVGAAVAVFRHTACYTCPVQRPYQFCLLYTSDAADE